jgi:uncharacterized membrane protein
MLQAGQIQQGFTFQLQAQHPLFPPPEAIKAYEAILPGAFDRIIKMAEKAQSDQTETVRDVNLATRQDVRRGQWLGAAVSFAALVGAAYCVYAGQATVACFFIGVPVMAVAKALVDSARAPKPNPPAQLSPPAVSP